MEKLFRYSKNRSTRIFLVAILVPAILLLAACSGTTKKPVGEQNQITPDMDVQAEILKAPQNVQVAYQFAISNPDALKNVPCYCGCGAVGHTSNYSCYVKEVKPSGEVVYDAHALFCYLCVQINEDTQKMTQEGKSLAEIRAVIDSTYSQYGKSNMEPVN
jgi:hypothetical protein